MLVGVEDVSAVGHDGHSQKSDAVSNKAGMEKAYRDEDVVQEEVQTWRETGTNCQDNLI